MILSRTKILFNYYISIYRYILMSRPPGSRNLSLDDKIDHVRHLMANYRMPEVLRRIRETFGIAQSTAKDWVAQAKAYSLGVLNRTQGELRADINDFLDDVIHNSKASIHDRIMAAKTQMRLCGLESVVVVKAERPLFNPDTERGLLYPTSYKRCTSVHSSNNGYSHPPELPDSEPPPATGDQDSQPFDLDHS